MTLDPDTSPATAKSWRSRRTTSSVAPRHGPERTWEAARRGTSKYPSAPCTGPARSRGRACHPSGRGRMRRSGAPRSRRRRWPARDDSHHRVVRREEDPREDQRRRLSVDEKVVVLQRAAACGHAAGIFGKACWVQSTEKPSDSKQRTARPNRADPDQRTGENARVLCFVGQSTFNQPVLGWSPRGLTTSAFCTRSAAQNAKLHTAEPVVERLIFLFMRRAEPSAVLRVPR
jgi:hypothetical protein